MQKLNCRGIFEQNVKCSGKEFREGIYVKTSRTDGNGEKPCDSGRSHDQNKRCVLSGTISSGIGV